MRLNKKIKGFTLVELLITMSLSAVAIACAYLAYNSVFGSFARYQQINAELKEYTSLIRYTRTLMQKANILYVEDDKLSFINKNGYTTLLQQDEKNALILPPESNADTLTVNLSPTDYYFGDQKTEGKGYVSKFILNMELNKQPFSLTFEKLYDAETLMRLDSLQQLQQRE